MLGDRECTNGSLRLADARIAGVGCAILVAAIYGVMPLAVQWLYSCGVTVPSAIIWRMVLSAICCMGVRLVFGLSCRLTRKEIVLLMGAGTLYAASVVFSFLSLSETNAGVANSVFHLYPVIVACLSISGSRYNGYAFKPLLLAVGCSCFGCVLLVPLATEGASVAGALLAILAALAYAGYTLALGTTALVTMPPLLLTEVNSVVCVAACLTLSLFSSNFVFVFPPISCWMPLVLMAVLGTVVALSAYALAVRLAGSTPAAIVSNLEPVFTVLGEAILGGVLPSLRSVLGCVLIAVSSIIAIGAVEEKGSGDGVGDSRFRGEHGRR